MITVLNLGNNKTFFLSTKSA